MKRRIFKLGAGSFGILAMALVSLAAYSEIQWDRLYDAPMPDIHASTDPDVIEQGRYLVYGPAHCAACHTPLERHGELEQGVAVPLTGGYEFALPLGTIRTANLTADVETGIGGFTDGEIARMLRHGVKRDGRAAMPFMEFQNLSDADLTAIVSYLRAAPAVKNEVAPSELNFIGRAVMATMIRPKGPTAKPAAESPAEGATVERGDYLVNNVAGCAACHTARNLVDGSYTGPRLAGGSPMPLDDDPSVVLVPPNLTPDPATGHIYSWTAEQFVTRFRVGRIQEGSHMPWSMFATMSDDDLKAIYLYLRSLQSVTNDTGPIRRAAD